MALGVIFRRIGRRIVPIRKQVGAAREAGRKKRKSTASMVRREKGLELGQPPTRRTQASKSKRQAQSIDVASERIKRRDKAFKSLKKARRKQTQVGAALSAAGVGAIGGVVLGVSKSKKKKRKRR